MSHDELKQADVQPEPQQEAITNTVPVEGTPVVESTQEETFPLFQPTAPGLGVPAVASEKASDEIASLIQRVAPTHRVKVYEDGDNLEVYLIHISSMPTHSTVAVLRNLMGETNSHGYHHRIVGKKEEVLKACAEWQ